MSIDTNPALAGLTAGTWTVDASHSSVGFVARHLMVAKTRGRFTDYTATVTIADNPLESTVEAVVQAASITTDDESRDGHLKSADFFEVETYPTLTLVSTGIEPRGADYVLHADLTIRGITKSVDFDLTFEGVVATVHEGLLAAGVELPVALQAPGAAAPPTAAPPGCCPNGGS